MEFNELKLIDFSQGIKSSEVMHNDYALQEQIERERLAIAGYGINYGLELSLIDEFTLRIISGTLVDKDGVEKIIKGKDLSVDLPYLIAKKQRLFSIEEGKIVLDDIPYSESRSEPAEYSERNKWGIEAYYEDSPASELSISAIKDNVIYTNSKDSKRAVIVTYNTAYDRIDTVYIDHEYELQISRGSDSTTPSAFIPENCKYVLGFVKVVSSYYDDEEERPIAKCSLIEEFDNRRTVYTDLDNNLYLCGVPFESLLRIYFEEPSDPKEGMLWYDMATNKLNVWRRTDFFMFSDVITYTSINPENPQKFNTSVGYHKNQLTVYIERRNTTGNKVWTKLTNNELEYYTDLEEDKKGYSESKEFRIIPRLVSNTNIRYTVNRYDSSYYWVPINDTSFVSVFEAKMWAPNETGEGLVEYQNGLNINEMKPERVNHDLRHFVFRPDEMHLRFTPYKNELSIMIDQIPLHRDQFNEITIDDILSNNELMEIATKGYGYTTAYLQELKENYQNIGLGFKLINSLDRPGFIEVNIQHRVNDAIQKNKFQRNASFSKTQTLIYDPDNGTSPYNLNGADLTIDTIIPYRFGEEQLEVYVNGIRIKKELIKELTSGDEMLGAMCKRFSVNPYALGLKKGSEIIYKITTNIYSYDHVDSAIKEHHQELIDKIADLEEMVNVLRKQMDSLLGND